MYGLRILKIILVSFAVAVGSIVLLVVGYWSLAKFIRGREVNNESLRQELIRASEKDGLVLANFHSWPAGIITFREPNRQWIKSKVGFGAIAPDGRHLFVVGSIHDSWKEGGDYGIFRPDGSAVLPLSRAIEPNAHKHLLSPDLTKLCVIRGDTGNKLFSLSPQLTPLLIADEKFQLARDASWNPSSSKIAFESNNAIYIYDLQKSSNVRLATGSDPAWSPTGAWIAFRSPEGEAMIVPSEGGSPQFLMKGVKVVYGFVWSPDAKYITFTREYPVTFPMDSPGYLGVYRLSDGARCIVAGHSFKGMEETASHGWLYASELIKGVEAAHR